MKVPLSLSTSIASIQWKLSTPSFPMYYEPIESLKTLRQMKDVPPVIQPIISRGIYETIQDIDVYVKGDNSRCAKQKHHLMLALGLILLGNGFIDEAHDLITPLSWNEDTYFGGRTMVPEADESVVAIASYAHSLLHRREGYALGEFGMIGYQNAKYWSNAALSRSRKLGQDFSHATSTINTFSPNDLFVYPSGTRVVEEMINLSHQHGPEAQLWFRENVDNEYWDPRVLHDLAAHVSKGDGGVSENLLRFAERACEMELRLLLECCLEGAGYDTVGLEGAGYDTVDYSQTLLETESNIVQYYSMDDLDVTLAQRVANRVSAAHIDAFRSNASVTVRKVLTLLNNDEEQNDSSKSYLSAASGLACRLLGSPAVRCLLPVDIDDHDTNHELYVFFPTSNKLDSDNLIYMKTWKEKTLGSIFYGGGDLTVGDAFCFQNMEPAKNGKSIQENITGLYRFVPCDASDVYACFKDRFYGSRGDTPTSVVQWSKGTIHKSI
mmetsp:Transcript_388/g.646  ORF Transcript_388/g.646 Transcript_388/m.646 type:complete len:495 (+) Transcript_388:90-1574(+)